MASYDLVIVGMGAGGMTAAEFAAGLGVRVAVVERGRAGGDCLWSGCVPSKALRASGAAAHVMRTADRFGLPSVDPEIDTGAVWRRAQAVRHAIAADDDDPDRYRAMGVEIIEGTASLASPNQVVIDGERVLDTRFVLLCTGSRPVVPEIGGLVDAGFLTTETLFDLPRPPDSMVMIGGGASAVELAQPFVRLGIPVAVLEQSDQFLLAEEPALADVLRATLARDGVDLVLGAHVDRVDRERAGGAVRLTGTVAGGTDPRTWTAAEVLVVAGRRANAEGLGLDNLGIAWSPSGIVVDDRLRTSVPSVYAAGDVAGRSHFTHTAASEAVSAVRDMFLPGAGKPNALVPWCIFTDPELAHVGLTAAQAEARYGDEVQVWRQDLVHADRARADATTEGCVLIVTAPKSSSLVRTRVVVGAHMLGPAAGEAIHELVLAIREKVPFSSLGSLLHVYPTLSTAVHQLAGEAAFERAGSFRWLVKKAKA